MKLSKADKRSRNFSNADSDLRMKKDIILLLSMAVLSLKSLSVFSQDNNDLYLQIIETDNYGEECAYVNSVGEEIIPFGKYLRCYTDTFKTVAFVTKKGDDRIVAIDRNEKELFQVKTYDNGPDYVKDGLFRIVVNDKIGFANMKGEIIIPPTFKTVYPFSEERAAFCIDCRQIESGEHLVDTGGKWGYIDTKGEVAIPAQYDMAYSFKAGKATVKLGNEKFYVDKNGNRIP